MNTEKKYPNNTNIINYTECYYVIIPIHTQIAIN